MWQAIKLCLELGFSKAIFEGDALLVINAINQKGLNMVYYGQLVENIKGVIRSKKDGMSSLFIENVMN